MDKSNHELDESVDEEDAEWQRLAAEQFLESYSPSDDIYDQAGNLFV
ncbi:MAG: hypothetical protein SH868_06590 [Bythopirellula sp.]|nr:hypothetical protein [Bythopirellula sp.]